MCHVPDQIFEDPFFVGLKAFLNMKIDTQPTNTLYYKILPSFFRIFRVYILGTSIKSIHATHRAWKKLAGGREKSNFQKSSVATVIYPIYCQEPRGFVFKSISDRVVNRAVEGRGQVSLFSEIGLRIVLRRFLSAYPAGGD